MPPSSEVEYPLFATGATVETLWKHYGNIIGGYFWALMDTYKNSARIAKTPDKCVFIGVLLGFPLILSGGGYGSRTHDLLNAIQALYQTELIPHRIKEPVQIGGAYCMLFLSLSTPSSLFLPTAASNGSVRRPTSPAFRPSEVPGQKSQTNKTTSGLHAEAFSL